MATEQNPLPSYLPQSGEEQHDWLTLTRKLWEGRVLLVLAGLVGVVIGVGVALVIPPEYTSTAVLVPQTTSPSQSQLSGLASLAGINIDLSQGNELSPMAYPKIAGSISFKLELMNTLFDFEEYAEPVSLYTYYTRDKPTGTAVANSGRNESSLRAASGAASVDGQYADSGLVNLTRKQGRVKRWLDKKVFLTVDKKDGFLTLRVSMPEPLVAAQVALKVQEMLQRDVIQLRTEKAQSDLEFIQARYNEVKAEAESYQESVAAGSDRFKDLVSNLPRVSNTRLQTKYNIANSVFQELAKQLEQAKIQVMRDTPVFTVIEPASVPYEKSSVRRIIIVALFALLGGAAGVAGVMLRTNLSTFKERWKNAANA